MAQHAHFLDIANSQYMQRVPLPAPRGLLFDRNGTVLVQNQEMTHIVVHRERVKNMERTLQRLAQPPASTSRNCALRSRAGVTTPPTARSS